MTTDVLDMLRRYKTLDVTLEELESVSGIQLRRGQNTYHLRIPVSIDTCIPLTTFDVVSVLDKYLTSGLIVPTLVDWANFMILADDIYDIAPHEPAYRRDITLQVLHWLAKHIVYERISRPLVAAYRNILAFMYENEGRWGHP